MKQPSSGGVKTPARTKTEKIADLNDTFRKMESFPNTYITLELASRGQPFVKKLLAKVQSWKLPTDPDDTDEERSFGTVKMDGLEVDWTIHYYDLDGEEDSPDPSDDAKTMRTLTLDPS